MIIALLIIAATLYYYFDVINPVNDEQKEATSKERPGPVDYPESNGNSF